MVPVKRLNLMPYLISFSGVLVVAIATWLLLIQFPTQDREMGYQAKFPYRFESVGGYFMQDELATDPASFDFKEQNFGLIDRRYDTAHAVDAGFTQWQRFDRHLRELTSTAPDGTTYKLIYFGRHGQGFHNVAEAYYGTQAWDEYWSKLDGNGTLFWADAHLTEEGKEQARANGAFLGAQYAQAKMPPPESYYASPLYRCLQTANLTFSGLKLPADRPFQPVIKELLREVMGEHTCDRRSNRTYIHEHFPAWPIEAGFSEQDQLWKPDHRETHDEHDARTTELLCDLFSNDQHMYLSLTSHSGAIASHLRVLGHRPFRLPTGGMIPVLVKATKIR